jgi:nucleoside-diphosphate-sugar epimerase
MKVLITGIKGFVGAILDEALRKEGHEVYGIDVAGTGERFRAVNITDLGSVTASIQEIAPDFIYHLAAISRVDFNDPSRIYAINVTGTVNILAAASTLPRPPRVLLVSSSQVYGIVDPKFLPITEAQPINPVNHYGASKSAAEHIALSFYHEQGLPVAIVRPFNHTGRGQDPHFFVPKIVSLIREGKRSIEVGNTSVIRDIIDVRDVVEAYTVLMESFPEGKVYNIAGGTGYPLDELLDLIQAVAGVSLDIRRAETLMRKNEILASIGDSTAFADFYGWQPRYTIRDTLSWMLS